MGQSSRPSENYLFLNVMVNFVIVNQKLTGSTLHIEKKSDYTIFKFWILIVEELYYPCSENKGADQLRSYCEADLRFCFRIGKNPVFS